MRVSVTISAPAHVSQTLRWAILPGTCGSGSIPVLGAEQFPSLDVGSNGRAQLSTDLALHLDASAPYHVNVYDGAGLDLSRVLTCGNLRLVGDT